MVSLFGSNTKGALDKARIKILFKKPLFNLCSSTKQIVLQNGQNALRVRIAIVGKAAQIIFQPFIFISANPRATWHQNLPARVVLSFTKQ
jgi:hypothetical protein